MLDVDLSLLRIRDQIPQGEPWILERENFIFYFQVFFCLGKDKPVTKEEEFYILSLISGEEEFYLQGKRN